MDQISIDPRSEHAYKKSKERLSALVQYFNESEESAELTKQLRAESPSDAKPLILRKDTKASWLSSIAILTRRSYKNLFRTPQIIITRMMQVLSFGIILAVCYLRIKDDQIGIQNMQRYLYECLALLFVGLLNAVAICK